MSFKHSYPNQKINKTVSIELLPGSMFQLLCSKKPKMSVHRWCFCDFAYGKGRGDGSLDPCFDRCTYVQRMFILCYGNTLSKLLKKMTVWCHWRGNSYFTLSAGTLMVLHGVTEVSSTWFRQRLSAFSELFLNNLESCVLSLFPPCISKSHFFIFLSQLNDLHQLLCKYMQRFPKSSHLPFLYTNNVSSHLCSSSLSIPACLWRGNHQRNNRASNFSGS